MSNVPVAAIAEVEHLGKLVNNYRLSECLREAFSSGAHAFTMVPDLIERVIDKGVWRDRMTRGGAADVTVALGRLDDDEKTTLHNTEGRGGHGPQQFNIINESGLYSLILTSRKPEAKRFKKWITSEVIPAIRRTGTYSIASLRASSGTEGAASKRRAVGAISISPIIGDLNARTTFMRSSAIRSDQYREEA